MDIDYYQNVTHYVIDIELSDKTKQMRDVQSRKDKGLINVVNSKWLIQKLRE